MRRLKRKWRATPEGKQKLVAISKKATTKKRDLIISHYGGECACCGEGEKRFLAIDHKNGGGAKERAKVGWGTKFYIWVIKNGYPPHLQLLCHNCNMAKAFYKVCPHTEIKVEANQQ
jgi:hypothetical protein